MAASQESSDQTPEPSAAEQFSDENRGELATAFNELREAIAENPEYQKKAARASLGGVSGLDSTGRPVMCDLPGGDEEKGKPVRVNYLAQLSGPIRGTLTVEQGHIIPPARPTGGKIAESGFHADTHLNLSVVMHATSDGTMKTEGESATLVKGSSPVTSFQEIMAEVQSFKEKFERRPQAPVETAPVPETPLPSPTKLASSPLLVVRTILPRR